MDGTKAPAAPPLRQFDTVLIANRGEIALRILRTLRAMSLRVAVAHHAVDAGSPAVLQADAAIELHGSTPVAAYLDIARDAGCSPAQLALAWLLAQGEHIIPIFGTRQPEHLDDNAGAAAVSLDSSIVARLDALINQQTVAGPRYNAATQLEIDTETYSN